MDKQVSSLFSRLKQGVPKALSQAITLIESKSSSDQVKAQELMKLVFKEVKSRQEAKNLAPIIGLTGSPGVGKSSLMNSLGLRLVDSGKRIAILAIDPSSFKTGGSILGDRVRMEDLSRRDEAFIRPSPSGQTLGGVAKKTFESVRLCQAAGYDYVFVETVGVGQSEHFVKMISDLMILLIGPNEGDGIQGIKKGLLELADFVCVTKADGELEANANLTYQQYKEGLELLNLATKVMTVSIHNQASLENLIESLPASKDLNRTLKQNQSLFSYLWPELMREKMESLMIRDAVYKKTLDSVLNNEIFPEQAAYQLIEATGFLDKVTR